MKKSLLLILSSVILLSCTKELEVSQSNTALGNFEALWETIDTKYCFIEEKGVDWQAIYTQYRPKVDSVKTERELFSLLSSMLDSLKDGHVNLYAPFDVSRNRSWYEGYPVNYNSQLLYSDRYLTADYLLAGSLRYNKIADDSIGLIRYESFTNSFSSLNLAYIFTYFSSCRGIVLDIRSNGGGSLDYAKHLAGAFFAENREVGFWHHKTGPGHDEFSQMETISIDTLQVRWLRPVVVLCNRQSYSATNFFVNAMRYADNCLIVGGTTGGGGGMPQSYELPNGWLLRFSSVKMYDRDTLSIEDGIRPHVEVNLTSADKDDLIEKAVTLINKAYKK